MFCNRVQKGQHLAQAGYQNSCELLMDLAVKSSLHGVCPRASHPCPGLLAAEEADVNEPLATVPAAVVCCFGSRSWGPPARLQPEAENYVHIAVAVTQPLFADSFGALMTHLGARAAHPGFHHVPPCSTLLRLLRLVPSLRTKPAVHLERQALRLYNLAGGPP